MPTEIGGYEKASADFDSPIEELNDYISILYQSGYLTIKNYNPISESYYLDIPNKEVRLGLMRSLLPNYIQRPSLATDTVREMVKCIYANDISHTP